VNAGTCTGAAGLGREGGGVAPANQRDVSHQMTRSIHHHTPHLALLSQPTVIVSMQALALVQQDLEGKKEELHQQIT